MPWWEVWWISHIEIFHFLSFLLLFAYIPQPHSVFLFLVFCFFFHCRKIQIKTVSSNKRTLTKKLTSITAQVHINKQGRRNVVSFGGGGKAKKGHLYVKRGIWVQTYIFTIRYVSAWRSCVFGNVRWAKPFWRDFLYLNYKIYI